MTGFTKLSTFGLALMFAGVLLSVAAYVVAEFQTQIGTLTGTTSVAYNVTVDTLAGLSQFSSWFQIIAVIGAAIVIIDMLLTGFGKRR